MQVCCVRVELPSQDNLSTDTASCKWIVFLQGLNMKTVLITGANRGIGLEHVRAFVAQDLKDLAAINPGLVEILPYDAADSASPATLKAALGDTPIDLLFASAGAMGSQQTFGSVDVEAALALIGINANR